MKSIMQDDQCCYICKKLGYYTYKYLELHHALHGFANRRLADKDGLTVWLCKYHHTALHDKGEHDKELQKEAQVRWMEYYEKSIDEFRSRYGKSYLT